MKIISVIGHTKSGKTTVVCGLLRAFSADGYSAASVKAIHREGFTLDRPGSDTFEHRRSGGVPVCAVTPSETALFFNPDLPMDEIFGIFRFLKKDIVIIEGMKKEKFPCVICAKDEDDARILSEGKDIICYAGVFTGTYKKSEFLGKPVFGQDDSARMYRFIKAGIGA